MSSSPLGPLVFAFFWLLFAPWVQAHPMLQNTAELEMASGRLTLQATSTVREIQVAQRLMPDAQAALPEDALRQAAERHAAYLASHLHVHLDAGSDLPARLVRVDLPPDVLVKLAVTGAERTFVSYTFEYALPAGDQNVQIMADMLREFPYAPGVAWEVSYNAKVSTSGQSGFDLRMFGAGRPLTLRTIAAPRSVSSSLWASIAAFFGHGIWHILTGWDHLLFVAALTLAAPRLPDLVRVIAAFTLAHTFTLVLSVLGFVHLSSSIVEPLIALSIVFVACENFFRPASGSSFRRLVVAFSFGLFHGLGFAGGLLETMSELPPLQLGAALTSFSVGVEVGHMIVVLPLFALLFYIQKHGSNHSRPLALRWGSAFISLAGCYYLAVSLFTAILPI